MKQVELNNGGWKSHNCTGCAAIIAAENSKLGKIPNLNLHPVWTCRPQRFACFLSGKCYALKPVRLNYESANANWDSNYLMYKRKPRKFWRSLHEQLAATNPRWFRWHSAGEIPDAAYWDGMRKTARLFPETTFLVFTKRFDLVGTGRVPANLKVFLSSWPGVDIPANLRRRFPVAWMIPKPKEVAEGKIAAETRKPRRNPITCPDNCTQCLRCWLETGRDVIFHDHS